MRRQAIAFDGDGFEGCDILTLREGKIAAKRSYRKGRV
jgi:hypothetical protein